MGIRLEDMEGMVQKFLGPHLVRKNKERNSKVEPPMEKAANKTRQTKKSFGSYSHRDRSLPKDTKSELKKGNLSCPGGQHSKMNELVKKVI